MSLTTLNAVPRFDIIRQAYTVLDRAAADAGQYDPRKTDVYEALDELDKQGAAIGTLYYRRGLEQGSIMLLNEGSQFIARELSGYRYQQTASLTKI